MYKNHATSRLKLPENMSFSGPTIYCPIQASEKEAVIAFGHTKLGFYTQEHVELLERFSDYTTQTLLSVEARLKAMESEQLRQEKERA